MSEEVCEQVSAVCEMDQIQTPTLTSTLTTDMTYEARSTRYTDIHTDLLNVGTLDNRNCTQSDRSIQTSASSRLMHISGDNSNANSNDKVKLANGTRGSIVTFLKFSDRHSGAERGSAKSGIADQNVTLGSNFEVRD